MATTASIWAVLAPPLLFLITSSADYKLAQVLALHHRTPDLAALIQREVDAIRDELHRDLLAQLDRRSQQVWIPVTVAALVPGAIFLLVPFFDALRLFGAAP